MNRKKVREKCEVTFYRRYPERRYKPVHQNTYCKFADIVRLKAASVVIQEVESQTDIAYANATSTTTTNANATSTTDTATSTATATATSTRTFLGWRLW